jgi:iron uptake system EfeUOB component EfeO/EfeM
MGRQTPATELAKGDSIELQKAIAQYKAYVIQETAQFG